MVKKIMTAGLCLAFVFVTTCAFAEDVYVTKRGKKYHRETCPFMENVIKNKKAEKVSKQQAIEQGRLPCSKCFSEEVSSKEKKVDRQNSSLPAPKAAKGK